MVVSQDASSTIERLSEELGSLEAYITADGIGG